MVGGILKEYCEQENKAYQGDVEPMEEESRNVMTKQV